MKIGKYTGMDIAYKIGDKFTTAPLALAYLRPSSEIYQGNYRPGEHRRILLTKKAIQDLKMDSQKYGASRWVTGLLWFIGAKDGVEFCEVADIEKRLKGADMKHVKSVNRGIGRQFVKDMGDAAGPDDFETAMRPFIRVQDLGLGAKHTGLTTRECNMLYTYPAKDYPFKKGSNAEKAVGSFYSGASAILHGTSEKPRDDMRMLIVHPYEPVTRNVFFYNMPESLFNVQDLSCMLDREVELL